MQPCNRCLNLGLLRARVKGQTQESLVYCTCKWAELTNYVWRLPEVTRSIEQAFEISKCPLAWFLPDNEPQSVPRGQLIASLGRSRSKWLERIRQAENFWAEHFELFREGA